MYNTGYGRQGQQPYQPPLPVPGPDPRYRSVPGPPYGYQPPPPPGADPQLWQWFSSVDEDRSGSITVTELQSALVNGELRFFLMYEIIAPVLKYYDRELDQYVAR